jgi:hypothetical protein
MAESDGMPNVPDNIEDPTPDQEHQSAEDSTPMNDEGTMAKVQLMTLNKQTGDLYNMVSDNEQLEGWVQEKLGIAASNINDIHNFLQYEKNKPKTLGAGDGAPAEPEHHPL